MAKSRYNIRSKIVTKNISNNLHKIILKAQKELQIEENIKYGNKAQKVTYQFASNALSSLFEGGLR